MKKQTTSQVCIVLMSTVGICALIACADVTARQKEREYRLQPDQIYAEWQYPELMTKQPIIAGASEE